MQLHVSPDNLLEWVALKANQVPVPLLHIQMYFVMAKAVMEAVEAGVFKAITDGYNTPDAVANACQLHPRPTDQLLNLLVSMEYLTAQNGQFALTPMAQKWIHPDSDDSVHAIAVYNNQVVWQWVSRLGDYLRTGRGMDSHEVLTTYQWELYQKAMQAVARSEVREFIRRVSLPKNSQLLLDIGGASGQYAAALCRKYSKLKATILDLPEALAHAPTFEELRQRITYQGGNALTDDLGENQYDVVLLSNVAHHFTETQNQELATRVAKSLKKGGVFIINEFLRPSPHQKAELVGSSSSLFFGLTSTSGNWSLDEIKNWQQAAGLKHHKTIRYFTIPGMAAVIAQKP
ncbi:MAG: methyltransferase [Runella sp.]